MKWQLTQIPKQYNTEYKEKSRLRNQKRLGFFSIVVLPIQVLALLYYSFNPFSDNQVIMQSYYNFYIISIIVHLGLLLLGYLLKVKNIGGKWRERYLYLFAYYALFWAMGVTIADQFQGEEVVIYYTVLFAMSVVIDIEPKIFACMLICNHGLLIYLLFQYVNKYVEVVNISYGSSQIVVFIILMQLYIHDLLKKNYIQKKDLKLLNKELNYLSKFDALSGVFNRGYWEKLFLENFVLAKEKNLTIGISIIDIDYFKEYNDLYGHVSGDIVIRKFGHVFKEVSEAFGGVSGRFGGDEFIAFFMDITKEKLESFETTLHKKIKMLEIEHKNSKTSSYVTLSVGLYNKSLSLSDEPWSFVAKADQNLYKVKNLRPEK